MKMQKKSKNEYIFFETYSTRWNDNDIYGHLNNAKYVELADSLINSWLINSVGLKVPDGNVIGLAVKTECNFFSPISYPEKVNCGLISNKKGFSSVSYEVGIFRENDIITSAIVSFIHVYVNSISNKPLKIPLKLEDNLISIMV